MKIFHFFPFLEGQSQSWTGNTAIIRTNIYQNNIRSDAFDAIPGDHQVIFWGTKAEKPTASGHDDGHDVPLGKRYTAVGYTAQPSSVTQADDLFAQKL